MLAHLKDQDTISLIKQELESYLKNLLKEKDISLEQPRNPSHGHLAWPLFVLAKQKKTAPKELAEKLTEKIKSSPPDFLKSCEALGGFVNFSFTESYIEKHLSALFLKEHLISLRQNQEHWVIDFASPNVAKYMNIGHLRATILGQALVNLARAFGVKVTAINHLGDWGSQFGKLLLAYKNWGHEYDFKTQALQSLVKLYVRFHESAKLDKKQEELAKSTFQKLEEGDKELKKLWKFFVDISLKDYEKYWNLFQVKHDLVLGESFYAPLVEDLKSKLKDKKLLEKSEGAEVVFLEATEVPCLITKNDGASTYSARDLCSIIYRFEKLKADRNIYITGSDQNLHFKQIFEVSKKLYPEWKNLHLNFGMYRFKGQGKMSSREGKAIYLKDILDQAIRQVLEIIEERNPDLKDKTNISSQVAIGALIFYDLSQDRIKDIDFEWSKVLDFEGDSGPFVQYSLVRSQSLLRKAGFSTPKTFELALTDEEEKQLAWSLIQFEAVCFQSLQKLKPHLLARYLLELAKQFNRLYHSKKIIGHPRESELLLLTEITGRVLSKGLELLNVPKPPAM